MAYKVIISKRSKDEIENAINYYTLHSEDAPINFIISLEAAYNKFSINPFERLRYKNIRALQLEKFPFALYFVVISLNNTVKILSCFHNKRNLDKRPLMLKQKHPLQILLKWVF